jgi:hypothetical protein
MESCWSKEADKMSAGVTRCSRLNQRVRICLVLAKLLRLASAGFSQESFTQNATSPIVTDFSTCSGLSWCDYDNDGFIDLYVPNWNDGTVNDDALYHNNGDGTFARVSNASVGLVKTQTLSTAAVWGDYDNDGFPDLLVPHSIGSTCSLYHNDGNGTFTRITSAPDSIASSYNGAAWGDYDNDGFIDLYIDDNSGSVTGSLASSWLYHNNGDSTFTRIVSVPVGTDVGNNRTVAWADYNNDGLLDLFATRSSPIGGGNVFNVFYRNNGGGSFTKISSSPIPTDSANNSRGCTWGDYDNSGYLSLFVCNSSGSKNYLYHNNGDGTFTRITNGIVVNETGNTLSATWGDYDNDGFLDLFVTRRDAPGNALYHNNGDGTFTKVTNSVVNQITNSFGCAWGDYDNDGFLDLVVGNGGTSASGVSPLDAHNFLYHNNGNGNSWLAVKLIGAQSNRSGIGAKVRVLATYAGQPRWQLRTISGGEGYGGQNGLRAHFGLGNASNVVTVRVEWPSGVVQELHDVAVKQYLTITEPPFLSSPRFTGGALAFTVKGARGFNYHVQSSTDLLNWATSGSVIVTNINGMAIFTNGAGANTSAAFFRIVSP